MVNIKSLIEAADKVDEAGLRKEADLLDQIIFFFEENKTESKGVGIKASTMAAHQKLLAGYQQACKELEAKFRKQMNSKDKPSPLRGDLRDVTANYAYNQNGVRLHQMYFDDLYHHQTHPYKGSPLEPLVEKYYYQPDQFRTHLKKLVQVARSGWILLNWCPITNQLYWDPIEDHATGVLAHSRPILALDLWEHAYFADFGLDKIAYLDWAWSKINWENPAQRLREIE